MNRSDSLAAIAPALVKALGKIEGAAKKKTNPAFKSKYADLETVIDASRDILTEHGLTVVQLPGALASGVLTLETVILHESGEFISGEFGIALGKSDPQGVGSALTYARRYALMAAMNMSATDDDGERAHGRGDWRNEPGNGGPSQMHGGTTSGPALAGGGPSDLKRLTSARAKEIGLHGQISAAIDACGTLTDLAEWQASFDKHTAQCPVSWLDAIANSVTLRKEAILAETAHAEMDREFAGGVG